MVGWWPQLKPRITQHACTVGFHVILHNEWSVLISAALIVRLGRRRGHSRFSRGLQRAVCSLRGWKTRLLASIFLKSGNRTRGRGRMKNRPKNRKLPDFRISGKNLNSGKTVDYFLPNHLRHFLLLFKFPLKWVTTSLLADKTCW